jgi:hypothetical protein
MIESMPDEDLIISMVNGFEAICADTDSLRMWQWEALDRSKRKLVAEDERRAYFQTEVARWRRAKANGTLPADADEEMLLLVGAALRTFPLALPQVTSLVTGMDPLDPEFRRKWSACLEWVGQRLLAPTLTSGDEIEREKADDSARHNKATFETRQQPDATRRSKSGVKADH